MGRRRTLSFGRKKYNDVGPGDDLPATAAYMNTLESLRDTIHDSTLFHCKQAHVEGDHVAYHPILLLVEREGLHILDPETEIELHFHPFNVIRYFRVKANRMYQIVEEHRGSDGKVARVGYTFRLKSDVERGNLKTIIDSYVQDKMEALQRKAEENKARKKKTMSRYNSQDNVVHETASGRVYLDANHPYLQAAKETQWLRFWSEEEQAHFYHNQETAETTWAEPDAWKDGEKLLEEQQRRSGQAEASSASTAPAASPTVATGDLISVGTPNEATPSTPPRTRALQGQDGDAPASPRPDTPSKAWADFANETPHAAARWDPLSDPFGLAGGSQPVVQPSAAANASNPFAAFASNAPGTTSTAPPSATGGRPPTGRPPTGRPPTGRLPPSGRRPPTASTGSNNPFAIAPPPSPGDSRRASRRRISNPKTPAEVGLALNTGTATATTAATTTTAAAGNNNNPFANSGTPGRTRSQSLDVNLTDLLF